MRKRKKKPGYSDATAGHFNGTGFFIRGAYGATGDFFIPSVAEGGGGEKGALPSPPHKRGAGWFVACIYCIAWGTLVLQTDGRTQTEDVQHFAQLFSTRVLTILFSVFVVAGRMESPVPPESFSSFRCRNGLLEVEVEVGEDENGFDLPMVAYLPPSLDSRASPLASKNGFLEAPLVNGFLLPPFPFVSIAAMASEKSVSLSTAPLPSEAGLKWVTQTDSPPSPSPSPPVVEDTTPLASAPGESRLISLATATAEGEEEEDSSAVEEETVGRDPGEGAAAAAAPVPPPLRVLLRESVSLSPPWLFGDWGSKNVDGFNMYSTHTRKM